MQHIFKLVLAGFVLFFGGCPANAHDISLLKLGRTLFEDQSLSNPPGQSCASCHLSKRAFSGDGVVAKGADPAKSGTRNVPTLMYSAFSPRFSFVAEKNEKGEVEQTPTGGQFWDGRANSLNDQMLGPLLNPLEMANKDIASVAEKLSHSPSRKAFEQRFGAVGGQSPEGIVANMARAIAAYERSVAFSPFSSKFDDVLRGRDHFNVQEALGFALFKDPEKGNCLGCHVGDVKSQKPGDWLFTDFTYDNLGLPRNMAIPANADSSHRDLGLCQRDDIAKIVPPGVTPQSLCGAFKVPTLRNVAVTSPYFRNGVFSDLREAVQFYVTRDTNPEKWYPKSADGAVRKFSDLNEADAANVNTSEVPYDRKPGEAPRLNDAEIDALVAFLHTLTDRQTK